MQTGFEYTYKNSEDLTTYIQRYSEMGIFELSLLATTIIIAGLGVYYIFPILYIVKQYWSRLKQKEKRKIILQQIATQRDIEDEIEAEIEELSKQNAKK